MSQNSVKDLTLENSRNSLIFDTSILIELKNGNARIQEQVEHEAKEHTKLFITAPTISEFYYGCLSNEKRKKEGVDFLEEFTLLNTTKISSYVFAVLKEQLLRKGIQKTPFDLLIASICIAERGTILTLDKDFQNIPGLKTIILKK